MTIREALERADALRNNEIATEEKVAWLAAMDAKTAREVFLMGAGEVAQFRYKPEELDHELLLRFPEDEVYISYLRAKIDLGNGEYEMYTNDAAAFNTEYKEFVKWFASVYRPAQGYDIIEEYRGGADNGNAE